MNLLLEAGANIEVEHKLSKVTPLHHAAFYGRGVICDTLLKKGANVHAVNIESLTPFMIAVGAGHGHLLDKLLKEGKSNLDAKSDNGLTALHYAAKTSNGRIAEYLIKAGANPNETNAAGRTALDIAYEKNATECIAVLEKVTKKRESVSHKKSTSSS